MVLFLTLGLLGRMSILINYVRMGNGLLSGCKNHCEVDLARIPFITLTPYTTFLPRRHDNAFVSQIISVNLDPELNSLQSLEISPFPEGRVSPV